jgi:hypothetical protein
MNTCVWIVFLKKHSHVLLEVDVRFANLIPVWKG